MKSTTKFSLGIILTILIAVSIYTISPSTSQITYVIDGDTVYVNVSGKGLITQTPHTLRDFRNTVEINFTSYLASPKDMDIVFGFNTSNIKPIKAEYYNPQTITETKSYSCNDPFWFNSTTTPVKHFWCWGNRTIFLNGTEDNETYLLFEHDFNSADTDTNTAFWNESRQTFWTGISDKFNKVSYNYNNKDTWYQIKSVTFNPFETRILRLTIDVVPGYDRDGKYDLCMKPSGLTLIQAILQDKLICLDPWFDTDFLNCKNLTITDPITIERRNGNDPVWFNVTDITFSNVTAELRVVDAACNQGGTSVPFHVISNSTNSSYITFLANVSTWSIYYNNDGVAAPIFTTDLSANLTSASFYNGFVATFDANSSTVCGTGSSALCRITSPSGIDFDDGGSYAANTISLFDGTAFRAFDWQLNHNSSAYAEYENTTAGWKAKMYYWGNAQFGPSFSIERTSDIALSDLRIFDSRNYNTSFDEYISKEGGDIRVRVISPQVVMDLNDTTPYSGYLDPTANNRSYIMFRGQADNTTWNWKALEGAVGNDNGINHMMYIDTSQNWTTGETMFFYMKEFTGFDFNVTFYDFEQRRFESNLSISLGSEESVDTDVPASLDYISPTLSNGSFTTNDYVEINITMNELNPNTCIITLSNLSEINYTSTITGTGSSAYCFFNATDQPIDSIINFSAFINDTQGNSNTTILRTVITDGIIPDSIDFTSPTVANGTISTLDYIEINVSFNETNPDSCIIEYSNFTATNYTGVITGTRAASYCFLNATDQPFGMFNFTVWINDSANQANTTVLRTVTLVDPPDSREVISNVTSLFGNQSIEVSARWTSGSANLDSFIVQWNASGSAANISNATIPNNNFSNSTFNMEQIYEGQDIGVFIYANDTDDVLNVTTEIIFTVTNEDPEITGITIPTACVEINSPANHEWTQSDNDNITDSYCNFTNPSSVTFQLNSSLTTNEGSASCSFTYNESGDWTIWTTLLDPAGNSAVVQHPALDIRIAGTCGSDSGGGGGPSGLLTADIIGLVNATTEGIIELSETDEPIDFLRPVFVFAYAIIFIIVGIIVTNQTKRTFRKNKKKDKLRSL